MKLRIGLVVLACALGACKGKKTSTTPEEPPSECARTATHATQLMHDAMGDSLTAAEWPKLTALVDERCTHDGWSAETMACMNAAGGEHDFDACSDTLTPAQKEAVQAQFDREIKPLIKEGSMDEKDEAMQAPTAAAPSPPPPDDPCGGGE